MHRYRGQVGVLAIAIATASLVAVGGPAAAEAAPDSWTHREDGRAPAADVTSTRQGAEEVFRIYSFNNQVTLTVDSTDTAPAAGIEFLPPAGQTLQSGQTYSVGGPFRAPTATRGQVVTFRDGQMCGRTREELEQWSSRPVTPTAGWFHVDHIEYVNDRVVGFAATYEISCQNLDGPLGFEGSIAVRAPTPAAPVPAAPVAPGPVADLSTTNTEPRNPGTNTTRLSWSNPEPVGDVTIDLVQSPHESLFTPSVGDPRTRIWQGTAAAWSDDDVDFMDVRTYRVVPRGPTGRLGTPTFRTIRGSRLDTPVVRRGIQIGEEVSFSGRLTEALGVDEQNGDPMSGPAIADHRVIMCRQPTANFIPNDCTQVDSAVTTPDGQFSVSAAPVANSYYTVRLPATNSRLGNCSIALITGVAPQTDLRSPADQQVADQQVVAADQQMVARAMVARATADLSVRRGTTVRFTTSRARQGSRGFVRLQHRSGNAWRTILTKSLGTGLTRMALPARMSYARGLHAFRVLKPGDRRHINGTSKVVQVQVR